MLDTKVNCSIEDRFKFCVKSQTWEKRSFVDHQLYITFLLSPEVHFAICQIRNSFRPYISLGFQTKFWFGSFVELVFKPPMLALACHEYFLQIIFTASYISPKVSDGRQSELPRSIISHIYQQKAESHSWS